MCLCVLYRYRYVTASDPNISAASFGSLKLFLKHSYNSRTWFLERQLGVRITTTKKLLSLKRLFHVVSVRMVERKWSSHTHLVLCSFDYLAGKL